MEDIREDPSMAEGRYETEVIYEVVDNSRRRRTLAAVLVVLILLLIGVGWFVWSVSRPAGVPSKSVTKNFEWVRSIYGWGKGADELLKGPVDVAVAPDGTIWTVSGKTTLVGFRPDGTASRVVPFARGMEEGQVNSIEGMDVGEDGVIYAADYGQNKVHAISAEGEILRSIGIQLPIEVAVRGDMLAVAAANGVAVFTTDGELVSQFASRGNGRDQVDLPHGIVWVDDDTILVSDTHNRRVKAYSPDGKLEYVAPASMEVAVRPGVMPSEGERVAAETPYQLPSGMTLDAAGRPILVDPFNFEIYALSSEDASITAKWGEFGYSDGQFAYPTGIDYDPARDYFVVADTANNRLQVIALPGSGGGALAGLRRSLSGPIWLCAIPLMLLLMAAAIGVGQRRRRTRQEL